VGNIKVEGNKLGMQNILNLPRPENFEINRKPSM
jgi:hypothetical protein